MSVEVIITDKATDMFGQGDTYEEANADLERSLVEYQELLERIEGNLGRHLKDHLTYLRDRQQ